jgi:hypothetical protein
MANFEEGRGNCAAKGCALRVYFFPSPSRAGLTCAAPMELTAFQRKSKEPAGRRRYGMAAGAEVNG